MRRHDIGDGDWAKIEKLLPGKKGDSGRTAVSARKSASRSTRKAVLFHCYKPLSDAITDSCATIV